MAALSEIAAAIRERREIIAHLETQKERMQKTEEIILATFLGDKKAGEFYWLDGYEARDEEVKALRGEGATLRELQRLDSDIIDTLRAELADVTEERNKLGAEISDLFNTQCEYAAELRAELQAAREALATRGELVALDREKVRKVVYESLYHHDALDRITDAVMQFGTPAVTEERAVAVLVEKGWVKTPVLVYCEQNSNLLRTVPTALVPPATATENK